MKQCNKCGEWLPLDAFSSNQAKCRTCRIAVNAEWQKQNQDRVRAYRKKYLKGRKAPELLPDGMRRCTSCKEVKSLEDFYKHKIHHDGIDTKCKVCNRRDNAVWKAAHPDQTTESWRKWKEQNIERVRQLNKDSAKRRRIAKQTRGTYTITEWQMLCEKYNHACLCCGKAEPNIKLTADHIQPLLKGGINTIANIQPLCLDCNLRKASKTVDYRPKEVV